jgi:cobalamin biosynthesis protein CobD/CbiB
VRLRAQRAALDPMKLAEDVEARLAAIFAVVGRVEGERREEMERAGEVPASAPVGADYVPARVATALRTSTPSAPTGKIIRNQSNNQKRTNLRVS